MRRLIGFLTTSHQGKVLNEGVCVCLAAQNKRTFINIYQFQTYRRSLSGNAKDIKLV